MSDPKFVLKRPSTGIEYPLDAITGVGRVEGNAIIVHEGKLSRRHAEITVTQEGVFVVDLASVNGTFVNERKIDANVKVKLASGDVVRFDTEAFVLAGGPPADSDRTEARTPSSAPPPKPAPQPAPPPAPTPKPAPQPAASPSPVPKPAPAPNPNKPRGFIGTREGQETIIEPGFKPNLKPKALEFPADSPGDPPYLFFETDVKIGRRYQLAAGAANKNTWSIGSQDDQDIRLAEKGISASHATLKCEEGKWLLEDALSSNGTFVNNKRIYSGFLSDGDQIQFSQLSCVFRIPEQEETKSGYIGRLGKIVALVCIVTLILLAIALKFLK